MTGSNPTGFAARVPRGFATLARRRVCASLLMLTALLNVAGLSAAEFSLNPTRVHLDRQRASETLVLHNAGDRAVSFETEVHRWQQADNGEWVLEPDDSLILHPLIVTVPAGEQARFRVGTLSPAGQEERAYRVVLQQLPDPGQTTEGAAVALLVRMSIPVFVQPLEQEVALGLERPRLKTEVMQVDLANAGGRYLAPQEGTLRLLDADGSVLQEESVAIGYVLAGARLPLVRPLQPAVCSRVARIELMLATHELELGVPVDQGARQCGR